MRGRKLCPLGGRGVGDPTLPSSPSRVLFDFGRVSERCLRVFWDLRVRFKKDLPRPRVLGVDTENLKLDVRTQWLSFYRFRIFYLLPSSRLSSPTTPRRTVLHVLSSDTGNGHPSSSPGPTRGGTPQTSREGALRPYLTIARGSKWTGAVSSHNQFFRHTVTDSVGVATPSPVPATLFPGSHSISGTRCPKIHLSLHRGCSSQNTLRPLSMSLGSGPTRLRRGRR